MGLRLATPIAQLQRDGGGFTAVSAIC